MHFRWKLLCALVCTIPAMTGDLTVHQKTEGSSLSISSVGFFYQTPHEIVGARLLGSANDAHRGIIWTEREVSGKTKPYFSILRKGAPTRARQATYSISLHHSAFDPLVDVPQMDLPGQENYDGDLHVVQYFTPSLPEYRNSLNQVGAKVIGFLPHYAAIVRLNPAQKQQVEAMDFVRWVGPYQPAWRLEPFLRDSASDAGNVFPHGTYYVMLSGEASILAPTLFPTIEALGGTEPGIRGKHLVSVTLTHEQLFQVATMDEVLFIDRYSEYEPDMDVVRQLMGADALEDTAGYTGTGVRGEAFDLGFNRPHVDFQSRPLVTHNSFRVNYHGAAVSGICFGDGTGDPSARGLLPDGQGVVADSSGLVGSNNRYNHTRDLLTEPYEVVFQTSSVGSARTLHYTNVSAAHDTMLFDFDVLHCQSQSNAKTRFSRPEAWAKNVLSGGAFRHQNTLDISDDCWDCGSGIGGASIGPAEDGRIKPDLAAFYDSTYTVWDGGPTSYGQFGGTSGATPTICGHSGLFFQMWSEGIFGNEVDAEASVFENRPHSTTAKAMMINSATPFDFEGETHDFSRTHQGWGRPDVMNLYNLRDKIMVIDETDIIEPFSTNSYAVEVAEGETVLRATMIFLDPAGNPAASEARVNDLTLRVTSPSGEVYWGNNGLRRYPFSVPGGSANTIDTVENVWVGNPEAGTWQVEVIADEINEDGHVETPAIDADYALVVSGITPSSMPLHFSMDAPPTQIPWMTEGEVSLTITEGNETLSASSPMLHLSISGGPYTAAPMENLGAGLYRGTLPAMMCEESVQYYFSAQTTQGSMAYWPSSGSANPYTTNVAETEILYAQDFEAVNGWTVGSPEDTATAGVWEWGRPLGRNDQPTVDHTPGGLNCFFTQQEIDSSGSVPTNDVDGGITTLMSPVYNLGARTNVEVSYWLWYSNHRGTTTDDIFTVEVSNDGGISWELFSTVGPDSLATRGGWHHYTAILDNVVEPTVATRFRFIASDLGGESRVEAALDDFSISVTSCEAQCLDIPSMREVWPVFDILQILSCLP